MILVAFAFQPQGGKGVLANEAAGPPTSLAQERTCPKCGYRSESGWVYCANCGWDLRRLVGEEVARRLRSIGGSVLGLMVEKRDPGLEKILSPKLFKQVGRYIRYNPGWRKYFYTAFPVGEDLFLTSADALDGATLATLRTYNNRQYEADILGLDHASGIGLLKAKIPTVAPLERSEGSLNIPAGAWAVCYPVAVEGHQVRYLPQSLSRGQIRAERQTGTHLVSFENLLRSDHTISYGCSGGPLVDERGGVVGIIIGSPDPGLTYAVPLSDLDPTLEALSQHEQPSRPFFGFGLVTPDERRRAKFVLGASEVRPLIAYLIAGSPAEWAGFRPGDILVAVGEESAETVSEAGHLLLATPRDGAEVSLTVLREGQEIRLSVSPDERPVRVLLTPTDELEETLEVTLREITTGSTSKQGLHVHDLLPGGRGEERGFKKGDIIYQVNGKSVRQIDKFNELVRAQNPHIFSPSKEDSGNGPEFSTYFLDLSVRAEGTTKEERDYFNMFPDMLAPPVY